MTVSLLKYLLTHRNIRSFSSLNCIVADNWNPVVANYKQNLLKKSKILNITINRTFMDLESVLTVFEKVIPPELAEKWDKTGLQLQPHRNTKISTIFFTIDLTKPVLEEAIAKEANLIISYHPPIFHAMPRLLAKYWKDWLVIECVRHNIAVYSPHTACDAVKGGVNDWLIKCLDVSEEQPIHPKEIESDKIMIYEFKAPEKLSFDSIVKSIINCSVQSVYINGEFQYVRIASTMDQSSVLKILAAHNVGFVSKLPGIKTSLPHGIGRIAKLKSPLKLSDCIKAVKSYLKLEHIRFSLANQHSLDTKIETVAVCAGSGASVLKDVPADLYITGEFPHHDILQATHNSVSVILCEHSNSERGYLHKLVEVLQPHLPDMKLLVSTRDKDPISIC